MRIERQIQGLVLQELNAIITEIKELQDFNAQALQEEERSDILVEGRGGRSLLIIELKDPLAPDGRSPYQSEVVTRENARASKMGCRFFVTCNLLQAVLWDRIDSEIPLIDSDVRDWPVLESSDVQNYRRARTLGEAGLQRLRTFLKSLIAESMVLGRRNVPVLRPVNERVVRRLDSVINGFEFEIADELVNAYEGSKALQKHIIEWTSSQYWSWEGTPKSIFTEMQKLTRLGLLMLINKIVFYRAMQSSGFFRYLPPLQLPSSLSNSLDIKEYLWKEYFERVTNEIDYETIFGEKSELLNEIIFESRTAADFVTYLIDQIKQYDFSTLDHDVVGGIFERLIREEERHKMGQYFTDPRVVDVILAYCLKKKTDVVLDPGCGSGTFLVRAHARLKEQGRSHSSILEQLWGIDIAPYPAHLSTLNLAIRDLRFEHNYPRIVNRDFFEIDQNTKLQVVMPDGKPKEMSIGQIDAVVGNPPYTRQEEMEEIVGGVKAKAQQVVLRETGIRLSKRAGIHAYFLLHAGMMLPEDGRLGFVVSNSWLDQIGPVRLSYLCEFVDDSKKGRPRKTRRYLTEEEFYNQPDAKVLGMKYDLAYGSHLQDFLLKNFRIDAIIDSRVEKWFPDADVNTCIVLLSRTSGTYKNSPIRFVQMKTRLEDALGKASPSEFVTRILSTNSNFENDHMQVRIVKAKKVREEGQDDFGDYVGSKWGSRYLRAPVVYFEIENLISSSSVLVRDIFTVKYGCKTGCNEYFIVKDLTNSLTDREIRALSGTTRSSLRSKKLRIIEPSGGGKPHLVEEEYLRSVVKSAREVSRPSVGPDDTRFLMLMANDSIDKLKGKYVEKYIEYGMKEKFGAKNQAVPASETKSCAARPIWYSLSFEGGSDFLVQKSYNDVFVIPKMRDVVATDRFYSLNARTPLDLDLVGGLLNSSIQHLLVEVNGRTGLGGGALDLMTFEVANLPMIDPRTISGNKKNAIVSAFKQLEKRPINNWGKERDCNDRIELDNAVLKALGVTGKKIGKLRQKVYDALSELTSARVEKAASLNARKSPKSVSDLDVLAYHLMAEFQISGTLKKSHRAVLKEFENEAGNRLSNKKKQQRLVKILWETAFPDVDMPESQTKLGLWDKE